MKSIYTVSILLSFLVFSGCSKDFLKKYDERIIGTWRITDVNRIGLGENTDNLTFTNGTFTFHDDGSLNYVNPANVTYKGSWEIVKKVLDDQTVRSLQVTAVDFTTQQVLTEYYDDMNFTGTDRFKAKVISSFCTYMTHFSR